MPKTATIVDEQTIEVGVSGPGDIARMFIVNGIAECELQVRGTVPGGFVTESGTFEIHVGPEISPSEFRRAVATASLASLRSMGESAVHNEWSITGVDSDFDDDSKRVQLQFDLEITTAPGTDLDTWAGVYGVGLQVIILAAGLQVADGHEMTGPG